VSGIRVVVQSDKRSYQRAADRQPRRQSSQQLDEQTSRERREPDEPDNMHTAFGRIFPSDARRPRRGALIAKRTFSVEATAALYIVHRIVGSNHHRFGGDFSASTLVATA